jgi:rare lipoprotein A
MNYRLRGGLVTLLCLSVIGPATKPTVAQAEPQATTQAERQDVVKLGTPKAQSASEEQIAKVYAHDVQGKPAVTLYVRNLPILTFMGDAKTEQNDLRLGTQTTNAVQYMTSEARTARSSDSKISPTEATSMARATAIAAQINQLHRQGLAADSIQVLWQADAKRQSGQYLVQLGQTPIAAIDATTTYAETTRNAEQDALLVANRLRRVFGDAKPLTTVKGKPANAVATGSTPSGDWVVKRVLKGDASWYGPGFHGNLTANGETFNQNAMTAAHPSLPFGTRLRVTNQANGRSVMVRVNDRGPYAGDRILDLSAGAADVIGLTDMGVAYVTIEIMERNPSSIASNP